MKIYYIILLLVSTNLFSQTPTVEWDIDLEDNAFGNSSAADIDRDGKLEIVFSTYRNDENIYAVKAEDGSILWKYDVGGCSDAAPLIYDVDNDNELEVILHSSCVPKIFCFDGATGTLEWQVQSRGTDSPPSIADVNNDNVPDLFDGDFGGYLTRYDPRDGTIIWETLVEQGYFIQTSPVLEDLNNDGILDIVVATYNLDSMCNVYAYSSIDGSRIWKSGVKTYSIYHAPTVADLDGNGIKEVIVSDFNGYLYCFAHDGSLIWKYEHQLNGYSASPTTLADLDLDGNLDIIAFSRKVMFVVDHSGYTKFSFAMPTGNYSFRGAIVGNMNLIGGPDIIFGNDAGVVYAVDGINGNMIWDIDLSQINGSPLNIMHAPLLADFDDDNEYELFIIGGFTDYPVIENNYGKAFMLSLANAGGPDWLMFRGNERRNAVVTNPQTSVEIEYNDIRLEIYGEQIIINSNDIGTYIIRINDILGRTLLEQKNNDGRIEISNIPSGVYMIEIISEGRYFTTKFIK